MKITEYELIKINKETKEKTIKTYNIDDNIEINKEKNKYMFKIKEKEGYFLYRTDDIYSKCLQLIKTYNENIKDFINEYEYITIDEYEKNLREYEEEQERLRKEQEEKERLEQEENIEENKEIDF